MLRLLFPRLTTGHPPAAALFHWITKQIRDPYWYLDCAVPDTVDGRFAMLATITALVMVRLEEVETGSTASAALTERFVDAMTAEHREMGLGDPSLGRVVRKLVGALSRRIDLWRDAPTDHMRQATCESIYGDAKPEEAVLELATARIRQLQATLAKASASELIDGAIS